MRGRASSRPSVRQPCATLYERALDSNELSRPQRGAASTSQGHRTAGLRLGASYALTEPSCAVDRQNSRRVSSVDYGFEHRGKNIP